MDELFTDNGIDLSNLLLRSEGKFLLPEVCPIVVLWLDQGDDKSVWERAELSRIVYVRRVVVMVVAAGVYPYKNIHRALGNIIWMCFPLLRPSKIQQPHPCVRLNERRVNDINLAHHTHFAPKLDITRSIF